MVKNALRKVWSMLSQMLSADYWLSSRGHGIEEKVGRLLTVRRVSYGLTLTIESDSGEQSQVHWRISPSVADKVIAFCRTLQTDRRIVLATTEYWYLPTDVRHLLQSVGVLAHYDGVLMWYLHSDVGVVVLGD